MPPITLAEAKAFLRVTDAAEDALIQLLIAAATERVELAVGMVLTDPAPSPLRLAILMLVAQGFEHREGEAPAALVEPWLAPYRSARL
jgi:hypothetical protein